MSIFNSLGSNYRPAFALRSLVVPGSQAKVTNFKQALGKHYAGQAVLTYKGREALELAIKSLDLPAGSPIGIAGFTCYVVYRAVERANCLPVFIDLAPNQLNYGVAELEAKYAQTPLKAII